MTGKGRLAWVIAGCWITSLALAATLTPPGNRLVCPADAPPLCEIARARVAEAESAVAAAATRRALWTTAMEAFRDAQSAFVQGDYQGARRAAAAAIEQARMGMAQGAYPTFPFPSH
jgi:hypothetical protein